MSKRKTKVGLPKAHWKHVYVMQFSDGLTKIGVSKEVTTRKKIHEQNTHVKCKRSYCTKKCSNAYQIESIIKTKFSNRVKYGSEWFDVPYDEVESYVKKIFCKYAEFIDTTEDEERKIKEFEEKTQKYIDKFLGNNKAYEENLALSNKNWGNICVKYSELLENSQNNVDRLLQSAERMNSISTYVFWYFKEICKENFLFSEYEKFQKDYSRFIKKLESRNKR